MERVFHNNYNCTAYIILNSIYTYLVVTINPLPEREENNLSVC